MELTARSYVGTEAVVGMRGGRAVWVRGLAGKGPVEFLSHSRGSAGW
ncbi:hypothetical protein GCM10027090_11080 [Sinomonas soli]